MGTPLMTSADRIAELEDANNTLADGLKVSQESADRLAADNKRLVGFIKEVMGEWPDVGGLDAFDLHEIGVKHGIVTPEERTTFCDPECNCSEYYSPADIAAGFTCYRLTLEQTGEGE